jgi:hypothetical protein
VDGERAAVPLLVEIGQPASRRARDVGSLLGVRFLDELELAHQLSSWRSRTEGSETDASPGMVHAWFARMHLPTSHGDARSDDPVSALGTVALVSGIVEDTRDLVAAHVEALRDDLSARLATLGATLGLMLIAVGVFVVTGLVLCLAVAASLAALGAPGWLALWLVTLAAAATGVGFLLRARTRARATGQGVEDAAARTRREFTKIDDGAPALFISPSPERRPT